MKFLSTKRNENGVQIICDNAIFVPNLAHLSLADVNERLFKLDYDYSECGHPLNLPFECRATSFFVKVTAHSILASLIAEASDDINPDFEEYINEIGAIEFDVRMTTDEELLIAQFILMSILDTESIQRTYIPEQW